MELESAQLEAMCLSGAVALPGPFPELGRIEEVALSAKGNGRERSYEAVRVTHERRPHWIIKRTILAEDVTGIFLWPHDPTEEIAWERGVFVPFAEFAQNPARARTGARKGKSAKQRNAGASLGIVYVRENARVLMQVDFGLTAADSAEYLPPMLASYSCPSQERPHHQPML